MDFKELINNEFFVEMQLGRCLKKWERNKLLATAMQLNRVLTVQECYELVRYKKILTPEQRELLEQHEAWLQESYETERMDRNRENWLFNRKL